MNRCLVFGFAVLLVAACGSFGASEEKPAMTSSSSSSSSSGGPSGLDADLPEAASAVEAGVEASASCAVVCGAGVLVCDDFERSTVDAAGWSRLAPPTAILRLEDGTCKKALYAEVPLDVVAPATSMLTREVPLANVTRIAIDFDLTLLTPFNATAFEDASEIPIVALTTNAFQLNGGHIAIGLTSAGFGYFESNGNSPSSSSTFLFPSDVTTHLTWHVKFGAPHGVSVERDGDEVVAFRSSDIIAAPPSSLNISIGAASKPQSPATKVRIDNVRVTSE